MKKQIVIFRHHPGLILVLVVLIGAVTMVAAPIRHTSAQGGAQGWSRTGSLNTPRSNHTATLLPDRKVLVAGGTNFTGDRTQGLDSAELYDPVTGKWNATGRLNVPRSHHTATLLKDGKLLIVGGFDERHSGDSSLNSTELYDPQTGIWSVTGSLNTSRFGHTATLLPNGKVLVVGGGKVIDLEYAGPLDTAELYDPDTGMWSVTGSLNTPRGAHTATLLEDGKVLAVGGDSGTLGKAELYDPDAGTWSSTGQLNRGRFNHTATLLPDGKVLVAGGLIYRVSGGGTLPVSTVSSELYDPDAGTWSSTGQLNGERYIHTATLLPDGKVLVAGGVRYRVSSSVTLDSSELYDPDTGTWSFTSNLNTPRWGHRATLLSDGKVLLVGGFDSSGNGGIKRVELGKFAAVPPRIIMASVSGKRLIIAGENFDDGAAILINGKEHKTRNDDQNPQTTLIAKKAGKKIKSGDRVQVRNPDGTISEEFIFTGL